MKEALNYNNLDKLAFIVSLSNGIKILNGEDEEKHNAKSIPVASPRLIICIRDFYLKNVKEGKSQTPNVYLEDMLEPEPGTKPEHVKFNEIKESIKQYFPKRKCFTLAQPAMGEDLQNIETLDENSLNKNFLKDIKGFQKHVYERKPKYVYNTSQKTLKGAGEYCFFNSNC
ncbi:guanylate-binding protein 1-like [Mercenaria mercenaria]|uniref:guanylate-binding protein 1-like n=1 Tax=Mercenaria mercenaria TaxID=6596 RepID=UPI00234F16F0|nr:guanylate-binding protein 1-like [Mercenaria mercenaria]